MIFGKWHPVGAQAAVFFGLTDALQMSLQLNMACDTARAVPGHALHNGFGRDGGIRGAGERAGSSRKAIHVAAIGVAIAVTRALGRSHDLACRTRSPAGE